MEKSILAVRTVTQDCSSGDVQEAVINATENCEPGGKNKTNWNLGEFLLAIRDGALDPNKYHLRFFHSIGLSIAHLSHWFHVEGWNGWRSVVNMALVEQIQRFRNASREEIRQLRAENRLKFFYPAIRNREIDEIRKLGRYSSEIPLDLEIPAHVPVDVRPHPNANLQREDVLAVIERAKSDFPDDEAICEILSQVQAILLDPDAIDMDNCRAEIVRRIADRRRVTLQQARTDLRRFTDYAAEHEPIRRIVRQLKGVSELRQPVVPEGGEELNDDLID
jgi:hypothetical protein